MNNKNVMICRCEDVTLHDLNNAMEEGYTTIEELKRILRIGMGACQGNTCMLLVQRELSKFLSIPLNQIPTQRVRPLTTGVLLGSIVDNAKNKS